MSLGGTAKFSLDGEEIEVVESFCLLGSIINNKGSTTQEVWRRLALGRVAMNDLDIVFKCHTISLDTKIRLVNAMIFSITMYDCESWTMKKQDRRNIDAPNLWC